MAGVNTTGHGVAEVIVISPGQAAAASDTELSGYTETAASAAVVTFAAVANKLNRLSGFSVDGLGATAGSTIEVTVTGLLGGTRKYLVTVPTGVTVRVERPLLIEFNRPVPASAVNTAISISAASFGTGNTQQMVAAHGFRS